MPVDDWDTLASGEDLATDRRLIAAIERHLSDQCKCWSIVGRDSLGQTAAIANLCLFSVDPAETTGPTTRKWVGRLRKLIPGALRFKVLFCGLPLPPGDNQLRIVPDADRSEILAGLHRTMRDLARKNRAHLLVMKEFTSESADHLGKLEDEGFIRGNVPPAYVLRGTFADLNDYRAALRSRYRRHLDDSLRRINSSGHRVEYVYGKNIAAVYTAELHALYQACWEKAEYRLEKLPRMFFPDLANEFGDAASLTLIRDEHGRVDGWSFSLTIDGVCHALCGGAEEQSNSQSEIYFNIFYAEMERSFRAGTNSIRMGQTSDVFKMRLGCVPENLCFYVKAMNPIIQWGMKRLRRFIFPAIRSVEPVHVFRDGPPLPRKGGQDIAKPVNMTQWPQSVREKPQDNRKPREEKQRQAQPAELSLIAHDIVFSRKDPSRPKNP